MEDYNFIKFWEDLDNGFELYYTYMGKRYLIHKNTKNCYTQELITDDEKAPHPRYNTITLKRVKELFPYMEEIEYRI